MRNSSVEDTRLVQVFLSPVQTSPNIFEVSSGKNAQLTCTCPGFQGKTSCKHTRFVQARIDANDGNYPLEISNRATDDDAELARTSPQAFREFVIKFAKIEVY
jgi:hypothetical protein